MNFEERLKRLEDLAGSIKDSDIPLEEALSLFEEGISLSRMLEKDLDKIEGKIQILTNEPSTTDDTEESPNDADFSQDGGDTRKEKKSSVSTKQKKRAAGHDKQPDSGTKPEFDLFSME